MAVTVRKSLIDSRDHLRSGSKSSAKVCQHTLCERGEPSTKIKNACLLFIETTKCLLLFKHYLPRGYYLYCVFDV